MVAFKKSIALAAFAVAGVNANGCTECCSSSSTAKKEVIPDEDSNSAVVENPTKPDSMGPADTPAPVVQQTKYQKAKENAQEKIHSLEETARAECNSMTEATKKNYENFADFVAEKKAQTANKIRETTAAAGAKIGTTFPNTTEATNTAFRKVSGAVTAATEKVAELQENFPKTKTTIYALTVVSAVGAVAHKFGMDAWVAGATTSLYKQIPETYRKAVETSITNSRSACTTFCGTSWSTVTGGLTKAAKAITDANATKQVIKFGKDYIATPVEGGLKYVVTKAGNAKTAIATVTADQMEVVRTFSGNQMDKLSTLGMGAFETIRDSVTKKSV